MGFREARGQREEEKRTDKYPRWRLWGIIWLDKARFVNEFSLLPVKGLEVCVTDVGG